MEQTILTTRQKHDRRLYFFKKENEELKMEFSRYPFHQLEPVQVINGIRVDGLRDIAANKLAALLDRFDPKDFVDLFFLLQDRSLDEIRLDAQKKFALTISPLFLGSELSKVKRIEALPRMVKPLTIEELRTFFTEQARHLMPNVLET